MSMLDEIKKELAEISLWPWTVSNNNYLYDANVNLLNPKDNATFIAKSPERIAALIEYVEAAEGLASTKWSEERNKRWHAAREKLGLK